ncbi:hypothetical protein [Mesorhizobium sp. NFR06]|uniref:hypothetical protein n=1 Tax=Mesorhizobium sp. NFR06 TaxID=1566290 RepID=UPI00165EF2A1|nr:hypothetical protein [Mesorhizobium sp. NFR06]
MQAEAEKPGEFLVVARPRDDDVSTGRAAVCGSDWDCALGGAKARPNENQMSHSLTGWKEVGRKGQKTQLNQWRQEPMVGPEDAFKLLNSLIISWA